MLSGQWFLETPQDTMFVARPESIPAVDGLIAATALRHGFAVVTRNEADFVTTGVELLNPWKW